MEVVFEFLQAALPWITIGLFLAFFFAKSGGEQQPEDYGTTGMSLGMCFGTAIGAACGNISIGICLGLLIGLAVGSGIKKEEQSNDKKE